MVPTASTTAARKNNPTSMNCVLTEIKRDILHSPFCSNRPVTDGIAPSFSFSNID